MISKINPGNLYLAESLIEDIMDYFQTVGLIAAIIDKEGNYLYKRAWGYADRESERKINEDTIFGLASITKSFTALAIMQLQERGILSVQDRVSDYLEDFTNTKIRIKHFLNHSPGFFPLERVLVKDLAASLGLEGELANSPLLAKEGGKLIASRLSSLDKEGIIGEPGSYFSYCNDGYGLLSEIIRLYGGQESYGAYLEKNILGPLEMTRSFCDFLRGGKDDNAASLYKVEDGKLRVSNGYHENAFVLNGGGALKSTLRDLKNYLCFHLAGDRRILGDKEREAMLEDTMAYLEKDRYGYGLYTRDYDSYRVTGHGGSLPGVSSNLAWSRELGLGVIVLSNTSGVPVSRISDALFRLAAGQSPLDKRDYKEVAWTKGETLKVLGSYRSGEGTSLRLFMDGGLRIEVDKEEKLLLPIGEKSALVREKYTDTYLEIQEDSSGELLGITLGSRIIPPLKEDLCQKK